MNTEQKMYEVAQLARFYRGIWLLRKPTPGKPCEGFLSLPEADKEILRTLKSGHGFPVRQDIFTAVMTDYIPSDELISTTKHSRYTS